MMLMMIEFRNKQNRRASELTNALLCEKIFQIPVFSLVIEFGYVSTTSHKNAIHFSITSSPSS
jgi:hypothetical protein